MSERRCPACDVLADRPKCAMELPVDRCPRHEPPDEDGEQYRYDVNVLAYAVAATKQLQAAQAEAAALRGALQLARMYLPHDKPEQGLIYSESLAPITAALSGDAGAAFLAEHVAMRAVVEAGKYLALVTRRYEQRLSTGANPTPVINAAREYLRSVDALEASAPEPEVNDDPR